MAIKEKYLTVGLLNAGSLGTRHDEFTAMLENFSLDMLAINETWLRPNEDERAPKVPGYTLKHIPRPTNVRAGRGGGVGFYIRKGINVRICQHPQPESTSIEQMWLSLTINKRRLVIGTAYRPPWLNAQEFFEAMTQSITAFANADYIVLLGDFNINLLKRDDNKAKMFDEFLHYLNLNQIVNEPTHFTDNSATLIDVMCTNANIRNISVNYIPELSHHALVTSTLNLKKNKIPPHYIMIRPLKNINWTNFNMDLDNINWIYLSDCIDINESVKNLNITIINLFDAHAPLKYILVKEQHPWITPTVKLMIKLRNESLVRSKLTKQQSHKVYYKDMKMVVINAIEAEKRAYHTTYINAYVKNPNELWKNLKKSGLIIDKKKLQDIPLNLRHPDLINKHFLDVLGNNTVSLSDLTYYEYHRHSDGIFSLQPVNDTVIIKIIQSLSSNAQGVDNISLQMLMLTMPQCVQAITHIVNKSIITSTFPDLWKIARVQPLPKCDNPTSFKDLRPISVLPCLSKILEKVVSNQMTHYIEQSKVLPTCQSGFRKSHSTSTALTNVVDDILTAQDNGMCTILVLLDFSRAFDSININLLLSKLSFYGFDIPAVKWFDSYLTNRSQFVEVVDGENIKIVSARSQITRGVPQGSILGPLLFTLYSSDITGCIQNCEYHLYADDVQLYLSFHPNDCNKAVAKVNWDLERINQWARKNCLVLNPNKSQFMVLGSNRNISSLSDYNFNISIENDSIKRVDEARNLGVVLDSTLRFETHVLNAVKNCFYRLKLLYRIRPYIGIDLRRKLCETLVLSKITYADTVYGARLLNRTKKLIQRVQNACTRFCFKIPPRSHVTPFINDANLLKMESRRKLHLATLLFGVMKFGVPEYLRLKLRWAGDGNSERTRNSKVLRIVHRLPIHKTATFRGSFKFAATKCWNDLPPPIRTIQTIGLFKIKLKKHLLTQQKENYKLLM